MRRFAQATATIAGFGVIGLFVTGLTAGSAQAAGRTVSTSGSTSAVAGSAGGRAGHTIVTVRFRNGIKTVSAAADLKALARAPRVGTATPRSVAPGVGAVTYTVPDAETDSFLAAMAARPDVASARRAGLYTTLDVPNDPDYETLQKSYLTSIAAPAGWDYGRGSAAVKIAIVDTGVDVGHPELKDKIVAQYDVVSGTTDVTDDRGHGTFVAGIAAAATNNAQGIAGVGFDASIIAIKDVDANGGGTTIDLAEGIRKAVDLGAKIINAAVHVYESVPELAAAVKHAQAHGVLVITSIANDGLLGNPKVYPAAYPGVLAVGATDGNGHRADFSGHGDWVSMAAPGVGIRGTTPRTLNPNLSFFRTAGYGAADGTSFSAPIVAGAAALLAARAPGATAEQLKAALVSTAHGYEGFGLGTGQLDVERAMATITPTTKPTMTLDPATPTVGEVLRVTGTPMTSRTRLALYVNGAQVAAPGAPLVWHTAGYPQTPHTVELRECAPLGGCATTGTTAQVTPRWAAPTISLVDGATVSGGVTVRIPSTSSSLGVAILVDGVRVAADLVGKAGDGTRTYTPEVNFSALPDGPHTVQAVICNRAGSLCNGARSEQVGVTSTSLRVSARGGLEHRLQPERRRQQGHDLDDVHPGLGADCQGHRRR